MDSYLYALLGTAFLILWLGIYATRKDLRKIMLQSSAIGACAGIFSEIWYLRDYWQPPSILGSRYPWPEDLLFGFALVGVSVSLYDVLCGRRTVSAFPPKPRFLLAVIGLGCAMLLLFVNFLRWNSIFVSSGTFLLLTCWILLRRRDLIIPSFFTGIALMLLMIPLYLILFRMLSEGYWQRYWFLWDTPSGLILFQPVPATELLWFFSWGCLAGALMPFIVGGVKKPF